MAGRTKEDCVVAFKEWAIIVDLLAAGDQIIILRKGGIHEDRGGFKVEHRGFFLYPTLFHQQRESVLASARERCDQVLSKCEDPEKVLISSWAEVADTRWIDDWKKVEKLAPYHAWTEEVIRERFG
jgi:hypothetical protein